MLKRVSPAHVHSPHDRLPFCLRSEGTGPGQAGMETLRASSRAHLLCAVGRKPSSENSRIAHASA